MKVSLLSYKTPEIEGPKTGVFSAVPHHADNYDKRYFDTSYKTSYCKKFDDKNFEPYSTKRINELSIPSGNSTGFKTIERIKITTKLMSEKYKNFSDPKENTGIQRTWHYRKDPAIIAVEDLGIDNTKNLVLPKIDNHLSLGVNDEKTYGLIKEKTLGDKMCYRQGSDITKRTNKVFNLRSNYY